MLKGSTDLNLDETLTTELLSRFNKRFEVSKRSKREHERNWWRNILYYGGHQWIRWDRTGWRSKKLDPRIPQPVTNKLASSADAISAALSKIVPLFTYIPTGRDSASKATASVCHHVTPVIYEETGIEEHRGYLAAIAVLTGNAFLQLGYDSDDKSLGEHKYTNFECPECEVEAKTNPEGTMGMCPHCGNMVEPTEQNYPVGKMFTECVLPFEAFPNPFNRGIKDWFIKGKLYDPEWVKVNYPDAVAGTASSEESSTSTSDESLRYTAQLMAMAPLLEHDRYSQTIEGTAIWEMWQEPDEKFPKGFYMAKINNKIVEFIDELPDKDNKGVGFLPWTRFGFKPMLGSFWHKSGVDDLASKQKQRNELESLIQLIYMTMANPVWLKPEGCNVGKITGLPGDQISYSPLAQAKPERVPGTPPHPILLQIIQQIDKDFEELGATFDILKGEKPAGVRAGYALQVLTERAMARYAPLYREWENSWEQWNYQALNIFRTNATEARVAVLQSKTSDWEVSEFSSSDLEGDISIQVEAGTGAPKSQLLERMYVKELMQLGLIDISDPREKMLLLEKYGMKHMATGLDRDIKDALEEEEMFVKTGDPRSLRFSDMLDNHLVMFTSHRTFAKGDTFRKMDDIQKQTFLQHLRQHHQMIQQAQQAQAQQGKPKQPQGQKQESGMPKEAMF